MAGKPPLGQERRRAPSPGHDRKTLSPLAKSTLSPPGREPPSPAGHETKKVLSPLERTPHHSSGRHERLGLGLPPSPGQERKTFAPASPRTTNPPAPKLERNESMVYEEEVPVIVRRRGCMLRVRITSFADDGDEAEAGKLLPPIPVCI